MAFSDMHWRFSAECEPKHATFASEGQLIRRGSKASADKANGTGKACTQGKGSALGPLDRRRAGAPEKAQGRGGGAPPKRIPQSSPPRWVYITRRLSVFYGTAWEISAKKVPPL